MGYDDNIFQTPTKSKGTEAVTVPVEVEPAIPAHLEQRPAFRFIPPSIGDGGLYVPGKTVPNGFQNVVVPATPAKIENVVVVPAQPAAKRAGSAVTQASASADMQIFTARSLFTFDVNGSASEYWSRPGGKTDYNGAAVFSFLYRLTPRLQFTSQFNGAYLSQPDLSRINTPQDQSGSNYLTTNAKSDLTYRWNRRVTSVFSISDNALIYADKAQEAGNYNETVFGTELRYLWSARVTYLSEVRFSKISYQGSETRDADTIYALIGAEARLTNRFSGTVRLGASMRTFTLEGDLSSTPYLEGSIAYRSGPTTIWNLTTRFGFEEPFAAGQERQVFRSGLSYSKTFSPRLSGLASSNFVFESTSAAATKSSSSSYDANARLEYRLTKSVSLNTNVSYLKANSGSSVTDYYRIRCFFGLEYTF
ncbi:MAG: hypothetical protein JWL59_2155 [Chthoniobacteraceae bacterium]|nr:hypothetical protein [Chthoniobacteraceae bacterium]